VRKNSYAEAETSGSASEAMQSETTGSENTPQIVANTVPFYRLVPKNEPHDRVGYVIPGVPGCIVIHLSMFKDGVAPTSLTLTCDGQPVQLAEAKVKVTDAVKAAAAAIKAQEKLDKAQAKIEAQAAKAEAARVKAEAALAKATAAASV